MFFHLRVFFRSLIFSGILLTATSEYVGDTLSEMLLGEKWWLVFLLFASLSMFLYFFSKKLAKKINLHSVVVIFFVSSFGLLYFVNSKIEQYILISILGIAFYFLEFSLFRLHQYNKDETALGIFEAASISTVFLFYAFFMAAYLNFNVPIWFLMLIFFIVTFLISNRYFFLVSDDRKKSVSNAFIMGFIMAEISWIMNFWPFGYLTTAATALIFYYVFWDIIKGNLLNRLTKKGLFLNFAILGIAAFFVLASSHWLPVF